jgi:group I intron endonuclease
MARAEKNFGVYAVRNTVTGKLYIGAGNLENRRRDHFSKLWSGCHQNRYLQRDADQYGVEAMDFFVLEYCDEVRERRLLERDWIRRFAADDARFGYNQSDSFGWSPEARRRDTERKLIRYRQFVLLDGVRLADPMDHIYLESCLQARCREGGAKSY